VTDLLNFSAENNIPFIIISASWIWKKSINYFLKEKWLLTDNVHIISNDFHWDESWKAIWYKEPIIHSFNKSETVLKQNPEIYNKIENRKNVILLWDSLWDHHMIDWFEYKNLIKIWFLNEKEDELFESYKEIYDIVLTWDSEGEILNDLLK
jgi:5'-nucleotidase